MSDTSEAAVRARVAAEHRHEPPGRAGPVARAELAVGGMHCESCALLIQEVLAEQVGVLDASVDLPTARALVEYDTSQLDVNRLTGAIAAAGYSASPVG